jgi:hypothetical protein
MAKIDAVSVVEDFRKSVWPARNPEAIDRFVADDFVITTDGSMLFPRPIQGLGGRLPGAHRQF